MANKTMFVVTRPSSGARYCDRPVRLKSSRAAAVVDSVDEISDLWEHHTAAGVVVMCVRVLHF